ncbi:unnamed protein product, partial [marine sediment metagenome]
RSSPKQAAHNPRVAPRRCHVQSSVTPTVTHVYRRAPRHQEGDYGATVPFITNRFVQERTLLGITTAGAHQPLRLTVGQAIKQTSYSRYLASTTRATRNLHPKRAVTRRPVAPVATVPGTRSNHAPCHWARVNASAGID